MKVDKKDVVTLIGLLIVIVMLSGCTTQKGMATGWSMQVSIVPVTQVNNQEALGK